MSSFRIGAMILVRLEHSHLPRHTLAGGFSGAEVDSAHHTEAPELFLRWLQVSMTDVWVVIWHADHVAVCMLCARVPDPLQILRAANMDIWGHVVRDDEANNGPPKRPCALHLHGCKNHACIFSCDMCSGKRSVQYRCWTLAPYVLPQQGQSARTVFSRLM